MKAQGVRVADVFLFAPVMVLGGKSLYQKNEKLLGGSLIAIGIGTAVYNARNYWLMEKRLRALRR